MNIITHTYRYLPHQIDTRYHAVLLYRNGNTVNFVCRRYKISKSSLMRWNKWFDGTKTSIMDKSHRPLTRHPSSLFRLLRKLGFFKDKKKEKKPYIPKPYHTPEKIGVKWQLDVKYVPKHCYHGSLSDFFYQYTVIDEASRERFIYPFTVMRI